MRTRAIAAAMLVAACLCPCVGCGRGDAKGVAGTFYIDSDKGDDCSDGMSPRRAWRTLHRASQEPLPAGFNLLLKRGGTYEGVLEIRGEGTADMPMVVGAYGRGAAPLVKAYHLTVRDLEIVNTGSERLAGRTGIKVECYDHGVSRNIRLSGLVVRDVNGSLVKADGGGSGILIVNGGERVRSRFDSLTIEGCHIMRCSRNAMIWAGYSRRENWYPSTNIVVRDNLIEGVPGDGIVPIGCDGVLIERNVMRDCPEILPEGQAAAGFWPWSCDNTVIQFNDVSGHKAPIDAHGYDSDWNCTNTVIQYNYSHDNYGGMILVCDNADAHGAFSIGNVGTVVRYNISIGDGMRPVLERGKWFSPIIQVSGAAEHTLIDHNIAHSNVKTVPEADRTMVTSEKWGGYANDTRFSYNLLYSAEPSRFDMQESTGNVFFHNWYLGEYENLPEDVEGRLGSRFYMDEVVGKDPTGFAPLADLMTRREMFGTEWHCVDKAAIEAFFAKLDE